MLYMSPVDVSRVTLPVHHPVHHPSEVKLLANHGYTGGNGGHHHHQLHQHHLAAGTGVVGPTGVAGQSPPPPYGMNYTTLVPCNIHPSSQLNLTDSDQYQSDHSTNHSYLTRESYPITNGDVCEV